MSHNWDKWFHWAGISDDKKLAVIVLLYCFHLGTFSTNIFPMMAVKFYRIIPTIMCNGICVLNAYNKWKPGPHSFPEWKPW